MQTTAVATAAAVATATATTATAAEEDDQYQQLLANVRNRFAGAVSEKGPLFVAHVQELYAVFLGALPRERRQHYTCRACQRFVDRFGGLVLIGADGSTLPVMWDAGAAPPFFAAAVGRVARAVTKAKVDGVFVSDEATWGLPQNEQARPRGAAPPAVVTWKHLSVTPPTCLVHRVVDAASMKLDEPDLPFEKGSILTADQQAAVHREEHAILNRGLDEFSVETVRAAVALLATGQLDRSEKCLGAARWLLDLHEAIAAHPGRRDNLTWKASATAPPGFCHVRGGVLGTLLEDVAAKRTFAEVKGKFDAKVAPDKYQRPQAPPAPGNIAQAEKLMAQLGATAALPRRFARIDEVVALWRPKPAPAAPPPAGVFGHLAPKGACKGGGVLVEAPAVTVTWVKFAREVLPAAESIAFYVPPAPASYSALVTAVDPTARPILQWDRSDRRNPFSAYTYKRGSLPEHWNLRAGTWHEVTAVTLHPHAWYGDGLAHQGNSVFFLLAGAYDVNYRASGGFFPEDLRSEFHAVRATMEAYARTATIAGKREATACGVGLFGTGPWSDRVRVTSRGSVVTYRIDRWD